MAKVTKRRIDQLLVERGLAESRQKAQSLIIAGKVLVNEQKVVKTGQLVDAQSAIRLISQLPFVSRAGAKLEACLKHFNILVADRVCLDLGASTGGFTDCLLQNGAREVHAFDVGQGQIAWKLRCDPRVVVHDGFNVRYITHQDLPEQVSLVTVDLSFISLNKILPPLKRALLHKIQVYAGRFPDVRIDLVLLVKPQFEVGKGEVGKGGVVRDSEKHRGTVESVQALAKKEHYRVVGCIPSPVVGSKGNQEFLLYLQLCPGLSSGL